jgi:L1 cell adhesion molecule like protein
MLVHTSTTDHVHAEIPISEAEKPQHSTTSLNITDPDQQLQVITCPLTIPIKGDHCTAEQNSSPQTLSSTTHLNSHCVGDDIAVTASCYEAVKPHHSSTLMDDVDQLQQVIPCPVPTLITDDHNAAAKDECSSSLSPAFRLNIDNLDTEQKVRQMTLDNQNKSEHYVQGMAVEDRVNVEHFPIDVPQADLRDIDNSEFLPGANDNTSLRDAIILVASLILVERVPFFRKHFNGLVRPVFDHVFSEEMKKKSNVIPLGIWHKSENKTNDLIDIMTDLQTMTTPGVRSEEEIEAVEEWEETAERFRPLPLGGDQLTCERCRGAHSARCDGDTPEERLEGLFSMIEDFHEKMNFLQVIMDLFYKTTSANEGGTLFQLRNLVMRRNVVTKVSKDYHADSEFCDIVVDCHVIAAVMAHFNMTTIDDRPAGVPRRLEVMNANEKAVLLKNMVQQVVNRYVLNDMEAVLENIAAIRCDDDADNDDNSNNPVIPGNDGEDDNVYNYATGLLKYGLLRKVVLLTTASGDGNRAMRNWKYGMLVYNQMGKIKYRLEAFLLQASVKALLPKRCAMQIIHNRFVNLAGGEGKNLDGDYVMELLNNLAKSKIKNLGPNHTPEMVMRIGKTVMFCHEVAKLIEFQMGVPPTSRKHTQQKAIRDRGLILEEIVDKAKVFTYTPGREHASFGRQPVDIFSNTDSRKLHQYLHEKKQAYSGNKMAF